MRAHGTAVAPVTPPEEDEPGTLTTRQSPIVRPAGGPIRNRRRLIAGVACGFILTTSGRLMPVEKDARAAGALGGKLGGRNGKNHRGRDKRRKRDKRKQRRRDRDQVKGFLNVALYVHNQRPTAVSVREWVWDDGGEIGPGAWRDKAWREIRAKPATGPDHFLDFIANDDVVVVELSTGHVIYANNPSLGFPHITIWSGKWRFDGLDKDSPWETLLDTGLEVNERRTISGFQVQRQTDGRQHKQFLLNLV